MVSLKSFDTGLHGFPTDYSVTVSELKKTTLFNEDDEIRMAGLRQIWFLSGVKESEKYSRWTSILKYLVFLFMQLPSASSYLRSLALTQFWGGFLMHVKFLSCQTSLSLFIFWEIFEQRKRSVIGRISETNKMERTRAENHLKGTFQAHCNTSEWNSSQPLWRFWPLFVLRLSPIPFLLFIFSM